MPVAGAGDHNENCVRARLEQLAARMRSNDAHHHHHHDDHYRRYRGDRSWGTERCNDDQRRRRQRLSVRRPAGASSKNRKIFNAVCYCRTHRFMNVHREVLWQNIFHALNRSLSRIQHLADGLLHK